MAITRYREQARHLVIASIVAFAILAASAFPRTAVYADALSYEPMSCTTDPEGQIFIALGRIVLRLSSEELTYIGDWPPERLVEMPSAPDPSEPEGCPGNPVQAHDFAFVYADERIRENDKPAGRQGGVPDRLKLVAAGPDDAGLQPLDERSFYETCERHGKSEELPNGLIACRVPPVHKTPPDHWAAGYMAPPDVYTTPFGRPFVVQCYPAFASGPQQCSVGYKLYEMLNVFYRFNVRNISIAEIIGFDRGLRARIESARVADFIWLES